MDKKPHEDLISVVELPPEVLGYLERDPFRARILLAGRELDLERLDHIIDKLGCDIWFAGGEHLIGEPVLGRQYGGGGVELEDVVLDGNEIGQVWELELTNESFVNLCNLSVVKELVGVSDLLKLFVNYIRIVELLSGEDMVFVGKGILTFRYHDYPLLHLIEQLVEVLLAEFSFPLVDLLRVQHSEVLIILVGVHQHFIAEPLEEAREAVNQLRSPHPIWILGSEGQVLQPEDLEVDAAYLAEGVDRPELEEVHEEVHEAALDGVEEDRRLLVGLQLDQVVLQLIKIERLPGLSPEGQGNQVRVRHHHVDVLVHQIALHHQLDLPLLEHGFKIRGELAGIQQGGLVFCALEDDVEDQLDFLLQRVAQGLGGVVDLLLREADFEERLAELLEAGGNLVLEGIGRGGGVDGDLQPAVKGPDLDFDLLVALPLTEQAHGCEHAELALLEVVVVAVGDEEGEFGDGLLDFFDNEAEAIAEEPA